MNTVVLGMMQFNIIRLRRTPRACPWRNAKVRWYGFGGFHPASAEADEPCAKPHRQSRGEGRSRVKKGTTAMAVGFHKEMRLLSRLLILSACLIVPAACGFCETDKTVSDYSLSLDDTIELAFKNNKAIQIQEQEVTAARATILGAKSRFLPRLDAGAGYTRNDAVLALPSSGGAKKDPGIFSGYKSDNNVGISLKESLYNGGADIANFKQAEVSLKVQQETLRAGKLDVAFEAKRLYYGLLLAYETERIASALMHQAGSHYEEVKKKYAQGTASRFDLLQSSVQVSKVSPELVRAKNAVEVIAGELKKLLGLALESSLDLKDALTYAPIEIREKEFLKTAYLDKPEMTLRRLGIDLRQWSIAMARSSYRPQVEADFGYAYRSNNLANMFNDTHSNWNAGVRVTIPIFDGFSSKAKVDEAKARYAQAVLAKEDLSGQIAVDIKRACLDLSQAEAIVNASQAGIEEAREALRIAEISYENGEGTNLDILDAQVSLSQIEKNFSEGVYEYLMAKAYLERSMGRSQVECLK